MPMLSRTGLHPSGDVILCVGSADSVVDSAVLAQAWADLGEDIVAQWSADRPGSRPWAWWSLEAPEIRRRLDGRPAPTWTGLPDSRPRFGIPAGELARDYESEAEYLDRLDLMDDDERSRAEEAQAAKVPS